MFISERVETYVINNILLLVVVVYIDVQNVTRQASKLGITIALIFVEILTRTSL